jgi:hypothetical protein
MSACLNRCAENVRIQALIIAKLKLVDVQMQVFLADFVEGADDPAFHDGPEPFNGVGMNGSADIFPISMMHHPMWDARIKLAIALMIVRRKQTDMMRNCFMHKAIQGCCIRAFNYASDHVSLALHGTDHNELSRSTGTPEVSASTFPFVFVLGFPADIGFIHFDIANQFLKFDIAQRHADFVAHEPCSFVGTESHIATDLKGANALLAREHQMNDAEPFAERFVSILEDRPDQDRKAVADAPRRAPVALPMIGLRMLMDIVVSAARAMYAFGPAVLDQIIRAGVIAWKHPLEIDDGHLMNVQGVFGLPHGLVSFQSGASMPC